MLTYEQISPELIINVLGKEFFCLGKKRGHREIKALSTGNIYLTAELLGTAGDPIIWKYFLG